MPTFRFVGVAALTIALSAPHAIAQRRGGAVSTGVRGAMVGGLVGGSAGAATGAKIGVVTGAARASAQRIETRNAERQAREDYQSTAEYQNATHSNFNETPPEVMVATSSAKAVAGGEEVVLRKNGKPVVGITYPSDWKQKATDDSVTAISKDGHLWSAAALLSGIKDKQGGIDKIKQGLEKSLKDIEYDDLTKKETGALVLTGTGKTNKAGVKVVFAAGVIEPAAGQIAGAAFVVDSDLDDQYKETVRDICESVRRADELAATPAKPAGK